MPSSSKLPDSENQGESVMNSPSGIGFSDALHDAVSPEEDEEEDEAKKQQDNVEDASSWVCADCGTSTSIATAKCMLCGGSSIATAVPNAADEKEAEYPYAAQLEALKGMGFEVDQEGLKATLNLFKGQLNDVISNLLPAGQE